MVMKITIRILSVVLMMTFVACHVSNRPSFKNSKDWGKLDGRLKIEYQKVTSKGGDEKPLECIIKTKSALRKKDKQKLLNSGFNYKSIIGRIITGSIAAKDLTSLAALDFVEAVELAVPLTQK